MNRRQTICFFKKNKLVEDIRTLEENLPPPFLPAEVAAKSEKTPLLLSWVRANVTSIVATVVDFVVTIFFTEIVSLWYVFSNALGAASGGVVSFTMCRRWVFNRRSDRIGNQAFRYILAICLSLTLNTIGVWFLTETFPISYIISKIIAAAAVGVSVNFLIFRYFVFK